MHTYLSNVMMWAACCLGYFAFLRAGEFTLQTNSHYNSEIHLLPAVDSHQEPTLMRIHLKRSKMDQMRMGVDLYVDCTFNILCPVAAMLAYLAIRGQAEGILFSDRRKVPYMRHVSTLASFNVSKSWSGSHSFFRPLISYRSRQYSGGKRSGGINGTVVR